MVLRSLHVAMVLLVGVLPGQEEKYGILGQQAPALGVRQWDQLPAGSEGLDVAGLRGRVAYLYFFQPGCPACRTHGFPMLQKLRAHYRGQKDIAFAAVQTVFEGFDHNTRAAGLALARDYGLHDVPVGFDPGPDGKGSVIVDRYNTGGTPWMVLLDKDGVVRFNGYGMKIDPKTAIGFIDRFRKQPALVGSKLGALSDLAFMGEPSTFAGRRYTLVRWWTDGCPDCAASLPALEAIRRHYDDVDVLAVYHPKPARKVDVAVAWAQARKLGFGGKVAADPEWRLLGALRERGLPTVSTSVTLLVDRGGVIRWVHQGPRLHPAQHGGRSYPAAGAALDELLALLAPAPEKRQGR